MMLIYRLFGLLVYVMVFPYGRVRAAFGDEAWRGRLALKGSFAKSDIWLHAASVGEVRVISYLIDFLKKQSPHLRIQVSVMTRAGYVTANLLFGNVATISFLPLDIRALQARAVSECNPKILVIAETEIWPNLIEAVSAAKILIVLVNGRMTERALGRYLQFKKMFAQLLSRYDRVFAKSEEDRARFLRLGATAQKCEMAGDMKFDAPLLERSDQERQEIRRPRGINDSEYLFVAGSTREGEEEQLLAVYRSIRADNPRFRLVLAPRHLTRLAEIEQMIQSQGLVVSRYSESAREHTPESIVLVDQMGLLNDLYMAADLAFVGGTLVDIGGHNVLEPVWAGTPVLFGQSVGNVREAAEYILENSYGAQVADDSHLENIIRKHLRGETSFRMKTGEDLTHSPTAHVGKYILRTLNCA